MLQRLDQYSPEKISYPDIEAEYMRAVFDETYEPEAENPNKLTHEEVFGRIRKKLN